MDAEPQYVRARDKIVHYTAFDGEHSRMQHQSLRPSCCMRLARFKYSKLTYLLI